MADYGDDFIDALNFQVKEEVVGNYLRERCILEEEINIYNEKLDEYLASEEKARQARQDLACLLVTPENFDEFFRLIGFDRTPLVRLGELDEKYGAPACPVGLTPRGFTQKGRYLELVFKTYEILNKKSRDASRAADALLELAAEINSDITRFHQNYDLLGLLHFLKSMDISMELKKKYLGDNFEAKDLASLEKNMTFRKVAPEKRGVRTWPVLPDPELVRKRTTAFLGKVLAGERGLLAPVIQKK